MYGYGLKFQRTGSFFRWILEVYRPDATHPFRRASFVTKFGAKRWAKRQILHDVSNRKEGIDNGA